VLTSLAVAIVVGVAETVVFASYLRKKREAKVKETRKREVKRVLGEYRGDYGAGNEGVTAVGAEREEIWGRGVNGGMRRRVREKWEKEQQRD